jgi:hypothetical protein
MLGAQSKTVNQRNGRRFESATALCLPLGPLAAGEANGIARRSAVC